MGEDFTHDFKEGFHCTVRGKDIQEARFNAWTALEIAIGNLPMHQWKLSQMQHGIGEMPDPDFAPDEDAEDNESDEIPMIPCVITEALWICNPESDGGKHADLLTVDPSNPDVEAVA